MPYVTVYLTTDMKNCISLFPKNSIVSLLLVLFSTQAAAHTAVADLEKINGTDTALLYLKEGFQHILPLGFDHILFVLGLFLFSPKLKPVLLQATAFTVAHTVTLGLSVYQIINPPASIVEPLIALSIAYVALENIFAQKIKSTRIAVVFLFGLVHGMGFASALGELGLPQNRFFSSLLLFNIGVELGQITVILAAWLLLAKWLGNKPYYRKAVVIPLSVAILFISLYLLFARVNFTNERTTVVDTVFTDSVLNNYNVLPAVKHIDDEIAFWKERINPNEPDYTNSMRYAGALINRFHISGDIADVKKSDSVLLHVTKQFKGTEAAPYLSLSAHAMLQHEFVKADSFLTLAKNIGLKKYEAFGAGFDVSFELGNMSYAAVNLKGMQDATDYGYQFRKSKLMHYKGALDSSINAMKAAYQVSSANAILRQAALSNLGDLYIHSGEMKKAADCFIKCIRENSSDIHSLMGLGWIALVHDGNDSLAERIFQFASTKTKSPEPLFKLIAVAQQRQDTALEYRYATAFEVAVSDTCYGNMYHKYMIQLYTGVLNKPAHAVTIASKELLNRNTPQTNAWYAWALFKNRQTAAAMKVFNEKVSGKPLEGLELYWMGKLLQAVNKNSAAQQYFYEAEKNKYDLYPAVTKDLEVLLK